MWCPSSPRAAQVGERHSNSPTCSRRQTHTETHTPQRSPAHRGRLTQHSNHVLWSSSSSSAAHPEHSPSLRRDSRAHPLILVMFVRPSVCLQTTHLLLPSSSHSYIFTSFSLRRELFCVPFFKNPLRTPLRPISASLKFFHILVPSLREPSPAGAHYRRAWSWLSGSPLICHIPVPTRCWAQQIEGVAE